MTPFTEGLRKPEVRIFSYFRRRSYGVYRYTGHQASISSSSGNSLSTAEENAVLAHGCAQPLSRTVRAFEIGCFRNRLEISFEIGCGFRNWLRTFFETGCALCAANFESFSRAADFESSVRGRCARTIFLDPLADNSG